MIPADIHDEAVIKLGQKCVEAMTDEYLSRHSRQDLNSYRRFLKHHLTYDSWLRSIVDPDEVLDCMERVRQEKLRTDEIYRKKFIEN